MDTILQQLTDLWTDFLAKMHQNIIENGASFDELVKDMRDFLSLTGTMAMKGVLEEVEKEFHEEIKATHKYHVVDKNRSRTLVTCFGNVEITRRYYREKRSGKYVFLMDKMLKIPANDRIDVNCKAAIVAKSAEVSYKKADEIITGGRLSRQSVCNAVRESGVIPVEAAKRPKVNRGASRIYIEADEDHVAMQNGKTKQNKLILTYEDKKMTCKGRRKLVAKRVFTGYQPASSVWKTVNEYVKEAYEPGVKVTIIGDGAAWIKKGLDVISNSEFALDLFHLSKYGKKVTGNKSVSWIYEALRANAKQRFRARVEEELKKHPEREKIIKEGARYIENQWEGARRSLNDEKISSSTEAHVSHILSDRLSSRGMGWSEENSEIIGSFRAYRENGGDLEEYLTERFQNRERSEAAGVQEMVQEGLVKGQERAMRRLRNARLGVRIGHMAGSEWSRNAWMRGIIDGNWN